MTHPVLQWIPDGRTDLVFDIITEGHVAASVDDDGISLLQGCSYESSVLEDSMARGPLRSITACGLRSIRFPHPPGLRKGSEPLFAPCCP